MKRARVLIALFATVSLSTLALSPTVHASTADGSTPAEETTCDTATGVAFGLCNAYCEATDCDDVTFADDSGCNALEDAFRALTADTLTCGSSIPDSTCSSKGYEQAERRYRTCFTTTRVIGVPDIQRDPEDPRADRRRPEAGRRPQDPRVHRRPLLPRRRKRDQREDLARHLPVALRHGRRHHQEVIAP